MNRRFAQSIGIAVLTIEILMANNAARCQYPSQQEAANAIAKLKRMGIWVGDQRNPVPADNNREEHWLDFRGTNCDDEQFEGLLDDLEHIPVIRAIHFDGTRVTDATVRRLGRFPSLELVSFRNTPVHGQSLEELDRLPKLRALHLAGSKLSDAAVRRLGELRALETLSLDETDISDSALVGVASIDTLRDLSLVGTGVTDEGLNELRKLSSLEYLSLANTKVTIQGVEEVISRQNLRVLDIRGTDVSKKALTTLLTKHAPKMDSICCGRSIQCEQVIEALRELQKLKARNATNVGTWPSRGEHDKECSTFDVPLRFSIYFDAGELKLSDRVFVESVLPLMLQLPHLSHLDLAGSEIGDRSIEQMSAIWEIRSLILVDTKVTDAGVQRIASDLPFIRQLDLGGTRVSDASSASLAQLAFLDYLSLDRTGISDAGLEKLANCSRLKMLVITDTNVTDAGVAELVKRLPECKIVR
jgi:Leucine-rich repeat (LRR) protein